MQSGESKVLHSRKYNSNIQLDIPEIQEAKNNLLDPIKNINICIFEYHSNSNPPFIRIYQGNDGIKGLEKKASNNNILFSIVSLKDKEKKKYIFLSFIGEDAGGIVKGKAALHKQGEISLTDVSDFEGLKVKVEKLTGILPY